VTGGAIPVDPPGMFTSPAFAQGMVLPAGRTLYVGGQNGRDASGELVEGGLGPQTEQALRNVIAVLEAAGSGVEHVAKLTIHLDPDVDPDAAFEASRRVWTARTAVTVLLVRTGAPGSLVEIEAIAAVPD